MNSKTIISIQRTHSVVQGDTEFPKNSVKILSWVLGALFTVLNLPEAMAAGVCSPSNLDGCVQSTTLKIQGSQWDNKTLRNCRISNTGSGTSGGEGILIQDVKNLTIENCEIFNTGRAGIRLGISGSTSNVTLRNNRIHDIAGDGINAGQRHLQGIDHLGLKIVNNTIYRTGLAGNGEGLLHGMYIQASDFLIEGNSVSDAFDGNGISVRSSGTIRRNRIAHAGEGAITYYSDHKRGLSNLLLIENNIAYGNTAYGTIQLLGIKDASLAVQNFRIRFNTAVSMVQNKAALAVGSGYSSYKVEAYGNIFINTMGSQYISGFTSLNSKNYMSSSLTGFVNGNSPFDFHLLSNHPAIGFATGVRDFPSVDIDNQIRPGTSLDAGADQTISASPVPSPTPSPTPTPTPTPAPSPTPLACSLKVVAPNGGESIRRGVVSSVLWSGKNISSSGQVIVQLLRNNVAVTAYRTQVANSGSLAVTFGTDLPAASNYKFQVTDTGNSKCSDQSDRNFTLR